jgi:hypothetical protein
MHSSTSNSANPWRWSTVTTGAIVRTIDIGGEQANVDKAKARNVDSDLESIRSWQCPADGNVPDRMLP